LRRGAREAGAERHIAPEAEAEAGNLVAFAGEDGDDAHRVVAPVFGGDRLGGSVEGLLFAVVFGPDHNLSVSSG
jgi:hypothetical protein